MLVRRAFVLLVVLTLAACQQAPPARTFPVTGQILGVNSERREVTIRHEDIAGYMPGMTMTFAVPDAKDLDGRTPGELVRATLRVTDTHGELIDVVRTGTAPLPDNANQVAMATALLNIGDQVPDAAFIDQTDRRRAFAEWKGSVTVVNFVYTSCPLPNFCPLMDQNFRTIQDAVSEDAALKGRVKLVSISIDPDQDTPAVLAAHAAKRRADTTMWTWLTGDRATVDRFAGRFGVGILRESGSREISHNLRTVLIDAAGRIRALYSGSDWTPGTVVADLRAALAS